MRNIFWMRTLCVAAVVLIGGYNVLSYLARNKTASTSMSAQPPALSDVKQQYGANPLLSADKAAVSRWFPGNCFAELYMEPPSFLGKMVAVCRTQVIREVKVETGVTLAEPDVRSAEVFAHFKKVYGAQGPWAR